MAKLYSTGKKKKSLTSVHKIPLVSPKIKPGITAIPELALRSDQATLERSSFQKPNIKSASCLTLWCISPKQRQPPSCVFPNTFLVYVLLGGVALWYSWASNCPGILLFS